MSIVRINREPSRRQLNQFGFIWLGFMALFGAFAWFRLTAPTVAGVLWVVAVVVPIIGWLAPGFMRLIFVGMSYAAWPVGFVVSHVILAMVYYLVLTPIGWSMRLFGYDPMARRSGEPGASRWVLRQTDSRGVERYFRQF